MQVLSLGPQRPCFSSHCACHPESLPCFHDVIVPQRQDVPSIQILVRMSRRDATHLPRGYERFITWIMYFVGRAEWTLTGPKMAWEYGERRLAKSYIIVGAAAGVRAPAVKLVLTKVGVPELSSLLAQMWDKGRRERSGFWKLSAVKKNGVRLFIIFYWKCLHCKYLAPGIIFLKTFTYQGRVWSWRRGAGRLGRTGQG